LAVLMGLSLLSSCVLVIAHVPHAATLIYGGTLSRVWSLAMGGLVAYTRFGSSVRPSLKLSLLPLSVGCVFALGALVLGSSGRTAPAYLAMVPGYSLVSLSALLVALATAQGETVFGGVLTAPPLRFVGRISYGLYLFHPFVYHFFMARHGERLSAGLLGRATLAVLAAVALATLSYNYFESYFLRMKSRFASAPVDLLKADTVGTQSA
jgi:peptidoglycan/LPS O-acetylase OafA/YrhL